MNAQCEAEKVGGEEGENEEESMEAQELAVIIEGEEVYAQEGEENEEEVYAQEGEGNSEEVYGQEGEGHSEEVYGQEGDGIPANGEEILEGQEGIYEDMHGEQDDILIEEGEGKLNTVHDQEDEVTEKVDEEVYGQEGEANSEEVYGQEGEENSQEVYGQEDDDEVNGQEDNQVLANDEEILEGQEKTVEEDEGNYDKIHGKGVEVIKEEEENCKAMHGQDGNEVPANEEGTLEEQEEAAAKKGEKICEEVHGQQGDEITDEVTANKKAVMVESEVAEVTVKPAGETEGTSTSGSTQEGTNQEHPHVEGSEQEESKKKEEYVNLHFKHKQPSENSYFGDRALWIQMSTVVTGPMTYEQTQKPELLPWFKLANYSEIYYRHMPDKSSRAFAKWVFDSPHKAMEYIDKIKETCGLDAMPKPKHDEGTNSHGIVVGSPEQCILVDNIPCSVKTEKEIANLFPDADSVFLARLDRHHSNEHRGYGFVEYLTKSDASAAFDAMKNKEIRVGNSKLCLRLYRPDKIIPRLEPEPTPNQPKTPAEKRAEERVRKAKLIKCKFPISMKWVLTIKNPQDRNDKQLRNLFEPFGTVKLIYCTIKTVYVVMGTKSDLNHACRGNDNAQVCHPEQLQSIIDHHKKDLADLYIEKEIVGDAATHQEQAVMLRKIHNLERRLRVKQKSVYQSSSIPVLNSPKQSVYQYSSIPVLKSPKQNVDQDGSNKDGATAAAADADADKPAKAISKNAVKPTKNTEKPTKDAVKMAIKRTHPPSRSASSDTNKRRRTESASAIGGIASRPHRPTRRGVRGSRAKKKKVPTATLR